MRTTTINSFRLFLLLTFVFFALPFQTGTGFALAAEGKNALAPAMTNSIGMEFVLINPGKFIMGTDASKQSADEHEMPHHEVTISKPFYMGRHLVTQKQWKAIMGDNPSSMRGDDLPVVSVSWDDAQEFIRRLNEKEGTDKYRLPTEAEWEYAARAGSEVNFSFGDDPAKLPEYAWFADNAGAALHDVGKLKPNTWGLYDVYGNVWEWTQDWYDETYYAKSPTLDPQGPSSGEFKVIRGGSWLDDAWKCRSAFRKKMVPGKRSSNVGVRVYRTVS